jgi:DNA replication protein DnaC
MMICQTCDDFGLVSVRAAIGDPLFGQAIPCPDCQMGQQTRERKMKKAFKTAGLPPHYANMTFATFEECVQDWQGKQLGYGAARLFSETETPFTLNQAATRVKADWYRSTDNNARRSIVMTGDLGTGKTGLIAAIAAEIINKTQFLYIRVQDLIAEIQATYGSNNTEKEERLLLLKTVPLLIADEFNLEKYTDDRKEILENIFRNRHGNNLPFLATTNLNLNEFRRQWGGRLSDIIQTAHWITVSGEKLRKTVTHEEGF